jgi:hypothetical protein
MDAALSGRGQRIGRTAQRQRRSNRQLAILGLVRLIFVGVGILVSVWQLVVFVVERRKLGQPGLG